VRAVLTQQIFLSPKAFPAGHMGNMSKGKDKGIEKICSSKPTWFDSRTAKVMTEIGSIGYAVRVTEWGKGYGTQILQSGLEIAKAYGMERVLLTINENNVASIRLCEKMGGKWQDTIQAYNDAEGHHRLRRYWIMLS
jgi:RimJ/RimL family protein N-acetyltransferase